MASTCLYVTVKINRQQMAQNENCAEEFHSVYTSLTDAYYKANELNEQLGAEYKLKLYEVDVATQKKTLMGNTD